MSEPERWVLILRSGLSDADALAKILTDEYTVVVTRNLEKAKPPDANPPAAVIASFDAGGVRLAPVLKVLRGRGWSPPIIAVTADPNPDRLLTWLEEGVSGYLARPYDEEKVAGMVASVVRRPGEEVAERGIQASQPVEGWVELSAPSHAEYLDRFQRFFGALHETHLDATLARQILMAVYELGHNAIEWGNQRNLDRRIKITYALFGERLVFKIEDEGAGFDVRTQLEGKENPLEIARARRKVGKRPGGLGLRMVRKLMDSMYYNDRGNIVIFEKSLPGAQATGAPGVEGKTL